MAAMALAMLVVLALICSMAHGFYPRVMRSQLSFVQQLAEPLRLSTLLRAEDADREEASKYSRKNLMKSVPLAGGVPAAPIQARRPSLYKPTPVKSSSASGGSGRKRIMNQGETREKEISNPNRLRIIAGSAKGKKIDSPDVYLRPMMAKVREALFSTLEHLGIFETNTVRVLDVFSGSGSVGLEALSRGAKHATFVDMSNDCTSTALRNAASCGFEGRVSAVCARAEEVLVDPAQFGLVDTYGLISMTPPYEEVVYSELIDAVCKSPLVTEDTLFVIEYPVEMGTLPQILGDNHLFGIRNRKYGRTVLGIYVYRPNKKYDMKPEEFLSLK